MRNFRKERKMILEPGKYMLHLESFERKFSKQGNEMLVLKLRALMNEAGEKVEPYFAFTEYITLGESQEIKRRYWMESMNSPPVNFSSDRDVADKLVKRPFLALVKVDSWRDRKSNKVDRYLPIEWPAMNALERLGYRFRHKKVEAQSSTEKAGPPKMRTMSQGTSSIPKKYL